VGDRNEKEELLGASSHGTNLASPSELEKEKEAAELRRFTILAASQFGGPLLAASQCLGEDPQKSVLGHFR
jgi:hypothetical protein